MKRIIAYDFGTTGVKTCLMSVDKQITLIDGVYEGYSLNILQGGGAEQNPDEWWDAMCATTKKLLAQTKTSPKDIGGITFCSQMQGLVLVDGEGNALRPAMSYMDQRAKAEISKGFQHGLKISGVNAVKLLKNLAANRAAPTSVKDPVWKYKWVERNEPKVFAKIHKWLDVKEYLICRCTGNFVMTRDSAFSTFLVDTRAGKCVWNEKLCKMYGINPAHLPDIILSTDVAGMLTQRASVELGLAADTPVYGGGGDAALIGLGAGCAAAGQTHIYWGTSGWVGTVVDKQVVDIDAMIAAAVGAQSGLYNYFAEMETAGKCFEWVKNHLALDEIDIYLQKVDTAQSEETVYESLYDYMSDVVAGVPAGSGGVIFTPWLHGNRCPFEDPNSAGMFFNIRLQTGKSELIRAVLEGICYHLRWMLECQDKKIKTSETIRFVGGGAMSPVTCGILADIIGRPIETVAYAKDAGAVGAAMLAAVAGGSVEGFEAAARLIAPSRRYEPNPANREIYEKGYVVFKKLYTSNKSNFAALNA